MLYLILIFIFLILLSKNNRNKIKYYKINTTGTAAELSLKKRIKNAKHITHLRIDGMNKNKEEGYGNMSMYNKPPISLKKIIINIELKKGDALLLPKGWWHWACSNKDTLSANIWNINLYNNKPKIIKTGLNKLLIDINNLNLKPWCNFKKCEGVDGMRSANLTLKKYGAENVWKSQEIEKYVKNRILKSTSVKEVKKGYSKVNVWNMTNTHCTPLHYDESDNVLVVLSGVKRIQLVPPEYSEYLFPLQIRPGIPKNIKNVFFMLDRGKRAYANEYWEAPSLQNKKSPPSCTLLYCFIKYWRFPIEVYSYITALQYAFGVQNIVYSCKLDFEKKPYLEFYIFAGESNRRDPYILEEEADLSFALDAINEIDILFKIKHNGTLERNSQTIYLSFEIYPEMFRNENLTSNFNVYKSSSNLPNNCYAAVNYFDIFTNVKKGTFLSLPVNNTNVKCEFYWKCNKIDGSNTDFYIGTQWDYSKKWLIKNYSLEFVNSLLEIEDIENASFELCDNIKLDGKRRVAFYGIV
jgi:hypothetical protein